MNYRRIAFIATLSVLAACGQPEPPAAPAASAPAVEATVDLAEKAREIARNSIIADGHIDVPYRVIEEWEDVSVATDGGDFDVHRIAVPCECGRPRQRYATICDSGG